MISVDGYCAKLNELAIGSYRTLAIRAVEIITSRMSRPAAERVADQLRGPITRVANRLGYNARVAVDPAHHYFPEFGQKAEHIQINVWKAGVKGSGKAVHFAIDIFR